MATLAWTITAVLIITSMAVQDRLWGRSNCWGACWPLRSWAVPAAATLAAWRLVAGRPIVTDRRVAMLLGAWAAVVSFVALLGTVYRLHGYDTGPIGRGLALALGVALLVGLAAWCCQSRLGLRVPRETL